MGKPSIGEVELVSNAALSGAGSGRVGRAGRRNNLLRAGLNVLLLAMIALPVLHCLQFTLDLLSAPYAGFDYSAYYAAGLLMRTHSFASVFDLGTLQAAARAHGAAVPTVIYTYPPLLAILLTPLTLFPYRVALGIWIMVNLALWLFCAGLLAIWLQRLLAFGVGPLTAGDEADPAPASGDAPARWIRAPRLFTLALAAFLIFSYQPIEQTLVLGQVSVVMLALLLLVPLFAERDHPYLAGIALALAIWIKPFPLVLLGYYLLRGRWRLVRGSAAGLALVALAQVPFVGIDGLLATREMLVHSGPEAAQFQNEALARVPLWIAAEFGGHLSTLTTLAGDALAALVGAAFVVALWRRWRVRSQPIIGGAAGTGAAPANRELLGYCWALATMVLVEPITWEHYDTWLLPVIVVCLALAIHAVAGGFRDARGHLRRDVYVLVAAISAYAITMHHLPLGYDGTATFAIGPYIGGHPVRPFFMLLRPLAALLAWGCSGYLWLRASLQLRENTSGDGASGNAPSPPKRLARATQARVLAGLFAGVGIMEGVLIWVLTVFGPYQPK